MEVYRRKGSPSWYFDTTNPTTGERIRHSLRFSGPKTQAQRKAQEAISGLLAEKATLADGITVEEACDRYISSLEAMGKVYAKELRHTQRKLFGQGRGSGDPGTVGSRWSLQPATMLHELTPNLCEALVLARTREGNRPQTIKHELGLLRSATRYAAGLGLRTPKAMSEGLVKNPWRVPQVTEKTRYLSQEEYRLVYDYLDPERAVGWKNDPPGRTYELPPHIQQARRECRDLLVALAFTGGRWSEVALLTWDRVDLATGVIKLWGNKTKQERLVPICGPLEAVLAARNSSRTYPTTLVFPGPGGVPRRAPSRALGDAMTACGLNTPEMVQKHGKATVHSLRHTFASWLIQNGAELGEVSDVLGHSSITMTSRYAHLSKSATVAKLGGILSSMGNK